MKEQLMKEIEELEDDKLIKILLGCIYGYRNAKNKGIQLNNEKVRI